MCQINLSELPGAVQEQLGRRAGLFQLFYCLECMPLYCTQDIALLPPAHLVPSLKSQAARVAARSSFSTVSPPEIGSLDRKTIDRRISAPVYQSPFTKCRENNWITAQLC